MITQLTSDRGRSTTSRRRRTSVPRFRPGCEGLEDRVVLSTTATHLSPIIVSHPWIMTPDVQVHATVKANASTVIAAQATLATGHHVVPKPTVPVKVTPKPSAPKLADPNLITVDLKPLDLNLLGLEVKTSEIIVKVSAQPGSGMLLGNLLTTVANLVNLQGVNNALNNVLGNVVTLANSASLTVSGVNTGGVLSTTTSTTAVPVLTAHVAPVHLNLLGAVVDTSPVDLSIIAHPGPNLVLGNVIAGLAHLLDTHPKNGKLDIPYLTQQIQALDNQLASLVTGISPASSPPHTVPSGTTNVLSLNVAPIHLNLLGLILQTDQIQVNADAQSGSGNLLGNLLGDLLNELNGTPTNMTALNGAVNGLLAEVVGILNHTNLVLPGNAVGGLSQTLQQLATPNLINTTGTTATAPVLNLTIASTTPNAPPVDVNLLGLVVTTSDVHAQLIAQTGNGQILGNLVYNVSHLLDPGGALGLVSILNVLGL